MPSPSEPNYDHGFNCLEYHVVNDVVTITLDRQEKLNAFSTELYQELRSAIRLADTDDGVQFVVLTGRGRAFATGGDLHELLAYVESDNPLDLFRFEDSLPFTALMRCKKTVIGRINGTCMAAGIMLLGLCDIAIASDEATFCIPEGRVGLPESWVPSLFFGRVSMTDIRYMALTADEIDAEEAERIRLVHRSVPREQLDASVDALLEKLRRTTPQARALYKAFANRLIPEAEPGDMYTAMQSPETRERLTQFAKRS